MRRWDGTSTFVRTLVAAGLSAGCAIPNVFIDPTPESLTIVAGRRGAVTVTSSVSCPADASLPCIDLTGFPLEYRVSNLPDGVTYAVDTSLQTPSTPTLVRIVFDATAVADAAIDVEHRVLIEAIADGRHAAAKSLSLMIVTAGPSMPLPPAVAVAAGRFHSLAVLADGRVAAWGNNFDGQLGLGHTIDRSLPGVVPALSNVTAVSGGDGHSLALTTGGTVWAWGSNSSGELGLGTVGGYGAIELPQPIPGLAGVVAVSAGRQHSLALTADGTVWSWGSNNRFALGTSVPGERPVPGPVAGLPPIQAIAAGASYSLAAAEDGSVWIWGSAALGALDPGITARPVQVAGLADILTLAASDADALALDRHGRVWGWGDNARGQAGDRTTDPRVIPALVAGLENAVAIAIGGVEGAALTADGRIWRWGGPAAGALDPADLVPRPLPAPAGAMTIGVGSSHVLVGLRCGQVWSWGMNDSGQLGVAADGVRTVPGIVPSIGDGAGCGAASVRVRVASEVEPSATTISATPPLAWDGREFAAAVPIGTTVGLSAAPAMASPDGAAAFAGWAGDCDGTSPTTSLAIERTRQCVAVYEPTGTLRHVLSIQRDRGTVTSTDGGVLGPSRIECGTTCDAVFPHGTAVTLSAGTPPGFAFERWSGDCSGTDSTTIVQMDGPRSCRAHHRALELRVTVIGGGRVTSDPAGIDCGTACVSTPEVTSVTLSARPDEAWQFAGWGGSCAATLPQLTVTMDADRSCTATFTRIPGVFTLTTVIDGDGTLASTPAGIACPGDCTASFPAGSEVELTAQPGTGGFILGWFDDCAGVGEPTRRVVLNRDLRCRVRFTGLPPYPVAEITTSVGVAGALVGEIVTINGLGSHLFDPVTGTSDPAGIRSLAWDLDGDGQFDDVFGGRASAGVVQRVFHAVGDYPVRLRVVGGPFDAAAIVESSVSVLPNAGPLLSLSVTKGNIGQGRITTTPPGLLECDETCAAAGPIQLLRASTVTLVAAAAPGSTFMGWSGAGCAAATESVTLALTADTTCTATFVPSSGSFPLTVIVNGPASSLARVTTLQPPGAIDCGVGGGTCTVTLPAGTPVMLRPDTATLENNLFQGWTGCDAVGTLWLCTLTMNGPRTLVATLRP